MIRHFFVFFKKGKRYKMFNKMKKMVAGLLATIIITTNVCPMVSVSAASGVANINFSEKI